MSFIFDRLVGLETEYAMRFRAGDASRPPVSKFRLYQAVINELRQRMPVANAKHFKEGVFAANGGAVWFESEMPSAGGGLIEGATPECRGPLQTVLYQRAQDRLLAECAHDSGVDGEFRLLKNNRDARGNIYGSQENYETDIATGGRLAAWRIGLVLLFPIAALTWLLILVSIIFTLTYFLLAGIVFVPARWFLRNPRTLALFLFGPDLLEGRDPCLHVPVWLESVLQKVTRVLTFPLAAGLYLLIQLTAFVDIRRKLLPFLVSRPIVTGCGMIDDRGTFHLADKAMAVNCVVGYGGLIGDRPIFNMGHLFKTAYAESWFLPRNYVDLFLQRQRLQISLGDSNMAEVSEFLRVGTTLLVLDALEAGAFPAVPRLRRPIHGLHAICEDPNLRTAVRSGEAEWTAIELQRFYWDACREFLNDNPDAPHEAWTVIRLWDEMLQGLESLRDSGQVPGQLVGSIDWVTKWVMLQEAGQNASWSEKKKIDLRYHELSSAGYFQRLNSAGLAPRMVSGANLERAMRMPPPDSPATKRGHYIREFSCGDDPLAVNWKRVIIGQGRKARIVPLASDSEDVRISRRRSLRLKT